MLFNKEHIEKEKKAYGILIENNIFTFLSIFINEYIHGITLSKLYSSSITKRDSIAYIYTKSLHDDSSESLDLGFKYEFDHFSFSVLTDLNQKPTNIQISVNEKWHSYYYNLRCLIFENDELVLEISSDKNGDSDTPYELSNYGKTHIRKAKLSKTWFACLEIIHDRIVELDSIKHDARLKSEEKKDEKFDFGEFD